MKNIINIDPRELIEFIGIISLAIGALVFIVEYI
jgi:hypothetical protein